MKTLALMIGVIATAFYALCYLQKRRGTIILLNAVSRILYILQYFLLGAFEGAVLDIAGLLSSVLARKKDLPWIKKRLRVVLVIVDLLIIAGGLLVYESPYSLLPILGVLIHTGAFWIDDERRIRRLSFLGSPFWLVYNAVSGAYGSCVGDILSMVSLGIAMVRYDWRKKDE